MYFHCRPFALLLELYPDESAHEWNDFIVRIEMATLRSRHLRVRGVGRALVESKARFARYQRW